MRRTRVSGRTNPVHALQGNWPSSELQCLPASLDEVFTL